MHIPSGISDHIRHDLFSKISYENRISRYGSITGIQLTAHFVSKEIFQIAWDHFSAHIPAADGHKPHTAKALFADQCAWSGFKSGTHIAIGRCLMYFVDHKMLPLHCINPDAVGTKLYLIHVHATAPTIDSLKR